MAAGSFWGGQATQLGADLPPAYFGETAQAFERARSVTGEESEFVFAIGGVRFRLRILGNELAHRITRTLAHLRVESGAEPDFTVCAWDDKSAGAPMPRPKRWMLGRDGKSCLPVLTDARYQAYFVEPVRILSCLDLETCTAYACYLDASRLSMYEVSGPMRAIFNAVLNRRGMQIVHGSAIGTSAGSLLFAGRPFSGKSTLAVRCLLDGLSYQADDLCVLTNDEQPRTLCLYNIAKLRDDCLPRFKSLAPVLASFEEDAERKSYFFVHEQFPERILREAPVRAIVLPRIVDEERGSLEPAPARDAMEALIACTVLEVPAATALGEAVMLRGLRRLPLWRLSLGRDEAHTLKLVRQLLAS
jgi:hypothetical protein